MFIQKIFGRFEGGNFDDNLCKPEDLKKQIEIFKEAQDKLKINAS